MHAPPPETGAFDPARSAIFASPRRTLRADGVAARLTGGLHGLAHRVAEALRPGSLAVGAVSFDGAGHLVVPESHTWGEGGDALLAAAPAPARDWRITLVPHPRDYAKAVRLALDRLEAGALTKVVLARSLTLRAPGPVRAAELLATLPAEGYRFAVPLPGGRTLLGASPELLVRREGDAVVANPLAGSAARGSDPAEDRRRAEALLASVKDRHEHRVVVEAVADALAPYCAELDVPEPEVIATGAVWHLSTRITGRLRDADTPVLELAAALHPTPAICGTPVADARKVIKELEPFDRGFYTGLVGWTDASGDGEWAIALRCAELDGETARLFAGAGIVAGSEPEAELAETSAKFRTMLRALGVNTDAADA